MRCRCKYRVRWFYSKGAFLTLVWCFLVSMIPITEANLFLSIVHHHQFPYWISLIPCLVAVPALLLSGWLADKKFGNYKVARFGLIVLFLGTSSATVCTLFLGFLSENRYLAAISLSIVSSVTITGLASFGITSLQLGLDQMPDASSSNITSFVAWYTFSFTVGYWIGDVLVYTRGNCINSGLSFDANNIIQIWTLCPSLCATAALLLDILLAEKWLIIEPKSPQSLTTIYQVLKFAAKHKAPLNRSALTYWEEDIPSRMDLGKSRYGGPFTTEQVEDVKTVLRLIVLSFPILVVAIALFFHPNVSYDQLRVSTLSHCSWILLSEFTYSPQCCIVIGTLVYEFAIYPAVVNRIPSILKRIGIASFLTVISSCLYLILEVIHHFHGNEQATTWTTIILYSIVKGLLILLFSCALLELVPAQAPYNMRGLFAGYMTIVFLLSIYLSVCFGYYSVTYILCSDCNINLIVFSVKLALSLFGFILYCVLARWYKRRVRDDVFSPHRVVEEVYDRYLTAEAAHNRRY